MLFDNIDLSSYFKIKSINGIGLVSKEISQINLAGMDGTYPSNQKRPARNITVGISIRAKDRKELIDKIENLNQILSVEEPVPIIFPYQPDRTYYGMPELINEGIEYPHRHDTDIHIVCFDPYKYGPEIGLPFNGDSLVINNSGAVKAKPVLELIAKDYVAFAMVQNHVGEYMAIGQPLEVGYDLVNTKNLLLEERGQTLDEWDSTPTSIDGGVVDGRLGTDNDGITVPSYGADTPNWHGPALIKDVGAVQDFEVEAMVQGRTTATSQTFRIEFYLFDEGMNPLGKMAIKDDTLGIHRKKGEGRVGPYAGMNENYLISSRNYRYDQDYFYGMLRMRRVGKEIQLYITRINNSNKHVQTISETFVDNDNEYAGKLKYIQIHIGKFADTDRAYAPKIDHIKVYELEEANEIQTPTIAAPGDTITFDHDLEEILINGEDRKDLKDFGGSFFSCLKVKIN